MCIYGYWAYAHPVVGVDVMAAARIVYMDK